MQTKHFLQMLYKPCSLSANNQSITLVFPHDEKKRKEENAAGSAVYYTAWVGWVLPLSQKQCTSVQILTLAGCGGYIYFSVTSGQGWTLTPCLFWAVLLILAVFLQLSERRRGGGGWCWEGRGSDRFSTMRGEVPNLNSPVGRHIYDTVYHTQKAERRRDTKMLTFAARMPGYILLWFGQGIKCKPKPPRF